MRSLPPAQYLLLKTASRSQIAACGGVEGAATLTRVGKSALSDYAHPDKLDCFMVTRVDADIDPLKKALNEAGVRVEAWASRVDKSLSKVSDQFSTFGKGLALGAVTAATAAFTAAIQSSVSDLGDLADQADRIGVLTDEMQVLRFAGISVGAAIDVTDDSITRFVKNVDEAQQGTGALYDITKQYGIALYDVDGKARSAMDVLGDVADVIKDTTSAQERLRIATDAFGKQGALLIPFLQKGREGLRDFKDEAIGLGVIIDKETIERADKFADQWEKAAYTSKIHLLAAFGDFFIFLDDGFNNAKRRAETYGEYLVRIVRNSYRGAPPVPPPPQYTSADPAGALARSRSDLENFANGSFGGGLDGFGGELSRRMGNLNSPSPFPDPKKEPKGGLSEEQKEAQRELNKLEDMRNALKAAGIDLDKQSLEQLNKTLETTQAQSQAQQMIKAALEDQTFAATDLGKRLKEQLEDIGTTGRDVANDLGLVFSSAFEDAIASGGDLKSVLQGLLGDISKIIARKMVTEPLGDFLGSVFSGIKFADGGIMTSHGSLPLRAYSSGGIASSPQLAMFGEGRTPEAYVPLPDGRTIPVTMRGQNGGGGIVIHQSNTFDARGADSSVLPQLHRMLEQNKRETIEAVAAQVGRGGNYAKKMGKR